MLKFMLAARRKPQDTQERYFYEWGIIHVALMVTSPSVMNTFRRYVQHYSISGIADDRLDGPKNMVESLHANDYVQRMQPHMFGDKEFVLSLTTGEVIHEDLG